MTDGSYYFEQAVKAVNFDVAKHIPEMIIVAVGAPREALEDAPRRRSYDFSSTKDWVFEGFGADFLKTQLAVIREQHSAAGKPRLEGGGAAGFLSFLIDDVRAALSRDYRMADDHVLFGDSGGGYFCTYALFARPAGFSKYPCGSPNLYSGNHELFHMEERYAKTHTGLKAAVFFGAGEGEILEPNIIPAWGIVSSMTRMAEVLSLRKYPSLELHARIFPGEDHASVVGQNLGWGLRTLWLRQQAQAKH